MLVTLLYNSVLSLKAQYGSFKNSTQLTFPLPGIGIVELTTTDHKNLDTHGPQSARQWYQLLEIPSLKCLLKFKTQW